MILKLLLFFTYLAIAKSATVPSSSCVLPLAKLKYFSPLVFDNSGILKAPTLPEDEINVAEIHLKLGEKVLLSCEPNYFDVETNKKSMEATCVNGQILDVAGVSKNFQKDLSCQLRPIEEILSTNPDCSKTLIEFGFKHPTRKQSFVLGEACYDETMGQTFYVHTKINYRSTADPETYSLRIEDDKHFQKEHPLTSTRVDFLRAARTMNTTFRQNFDKSTIPEMIQYRLISYEALGNYQFYNIMKFGWNYLVIADSARTKIDQVFTDFNGASHNGIIADTYIGTHGIMSATDKSNNKQKEIFVGAERFPVSKFLWILLKIDDEIIVFVIPNDGSRSNGLNSNVCPDKCVNGPIHCCDYKSAKENINELPTLSGNFKLMTF